MSVEHFWSVALAVRYHSSPGEGQDSLVVRHRDELD